MSTAFKGFPRQVRFTPVPNPLFGPLLEQIDDFGELKCTLRVIWHLGRKRGFPRFLTLTELLADRTLAKALAVKGGDGDNGDVIQAALDRAVRRGTLATATLTRDGRPERLYALNTEADRSALAGIVEGRVDVGDMPDAPPWEAATSRPNIFALYEDNIGMLSPMIAEELREAEQLYPDAWVEDAFREAVGHNRRSWRYISRILQRWEREGRTDGEPGGRSKKASYY